MGMSKGAVRAPTMVIEPRRGWFHLDLGELWRYREVGVIFVWRDIKVRYRQTLIGAAWAIVQPLVLMVVFTVILGRSGGRLAPPAGVAGPIFYFSALLPWSYFAQALATSTGSLVASQTIITRIYLPRLMLPLAGTLPGLVDFVMSFLIMCGLMVFYGVPFTARLLVLPVLLVMACVTAFGAGLWLSATNALYRDIREGTPFLIQVLMFTSVVFPAREVSAGLRWVLGLNPMATVIEGSRWAVIGGEFPVDLVGPGLAVMVGLLLSGLVYFKRIEDTIVDVV